MTELPEFHAAAWRLSLPALTPHSRCDYLYEARLHFPEWYLRTKTAFAHYLHPVLPGGVSLISLLLDMEQKGFKLTYRAASTGDLKRWGLCLFWVSA
jgi:hypothetical protein